MWFIGEMVYGCLVWGAMIHGVFLVCERDFMQLFPVDSDSMLLIGLLEHTLEFRVGIDDSISFNRW